MVESVPGTQYFLTSSEVRSAGIPYTTAIAAAGVLPLVVEVSIDDVLEEWLSVFSDT